VILHKILRYLKINLLILRKNTFRFLTNKIEPKTYILISSLIVGLLSGFAAVALKSVVHFFQHESKAVMESIGTSFLIYFFPLIGIVISILIIKFIFKGKITTGLSNIIYSIIRKKSDIPAVKIFSHLLTSGATVGMGGSVGLEAPIVVIGASIGSNIAKELKFNYHHRTLLLACGSAAGISAIFNSPIAGVIFAIEVLLPDITVSSFIPLLIASASSAVLSKIIYSGQLFFLVTSGWHFYAIPYYILLGLLCGFISLYMIRITIAIENRAAKIKNQFHKVLLGGMLLCFLIFLLPPLFGEGYSTIITLLSGKYYDILSNTFFKTFLSPDLLLIIFVVIIILTKVIATSLTIGAGGNGGIIAPSLFTGALTGFLLAHTLRYLRIIDLDQANFIVVGMAGILAGVLHAPLTGIFLIAEITGGYALIIPLMIVTSISFFISKHFNKNSVYTAALARQGIDFRSDKESFSVQNISLYNLVETDFHKFQPNMRFRDLVEKIKHSNRNLFPVVNKEDRLVGVITLDDVREVMLDKEIYDILLINEIMNSNFQTIDINSEINTVLKIFNDEKVWNIAVTQNNKFVGFISKSNLFNKYISLWHEQHEDEI
jgi:CIC family chloride channel protein